MSGIPLMVDVAGQRVTVVGGGKIAERRIYNLLSGGALIKVISPEVTSGLRSLSENEQIHWKKKRFSPDDVKDSFLIIAATNDSLVNQQVIEAAPKNALMNTVEQAADGNVQFPSHFQRGRLSISVSTCGASPILAARIKKDLEEQYDQSYEKYVNFLFEAREQLKQSSLSMIKRGKILRQLVEEDFFDQHKQKDMLQYIRSQK
ncbi:NAD(P)-binding protein [Halobacillus sp. B23F22_1]|uniref:NAD(P)-binding protein n=1 Tax=Halobacillus sp. B23F22_1 TaxID=3459514 RepID=UPI00373E6F74